MPEDAPNSAALPARDAEDAFLEELRARGTATAHPERYILGKPHPDRARQFKPFAALKGYEDLVAQQIARAADRPDFYDAEEPC